MVADRYRGAPICRNPWIVEAFLNGTLAAARRDHKTGRWQDVTSPADPTRRSSARSATAAAVRIAVRILVLHEDVGLRRDPATYPDLPNASRGTTPLDLRAQPE